MKSLLRIVLYTLSIIVLCCLIVVFFGVSNEPDIAVGWTLNTNDINRAKKLLHEGAKTKPDEVGTIELSQADLNLAANYLLNRYTQSAVKIELKNKAIRFTVTISLPNKSLFGQQYINISFKLGNDNPTDRPKLTKFKAGALLLPAKLAAFVIDTIIQNTHLNNYFILATRPLKSVDINEQRVIISYYSSHETRMHAGNMLTHSTEAPNLSIYQQKINEIINQHDPAWRLSLADLLKTTFQLALQRSTIETAINENKLAIMAVNNYVNHKEVKAFLTPSITKSAHKLYYPTFLYKRTDLAQHFMGSAAITASLSGEVAKVMGEEKELSDAQGGSGFSFIDLMADKAGTKFGEMAISSPENARKTQKIMADIKNYSEFMPDPTDLPEHMNEAEFKSKYQSLESPVYKELSKEIDHRFTKIPLYQ